ERDVSKVSAWAEIRLADQAAIGPEVQRAGRFALGIEAKSAGLKRGGVGISEVERVSGRGWLELWDERAPEVVFPGLIDHVLAIRIMINREAEREGLVVIRIFLLKGVKLAGLLTRFGTGHEFRFGERQQIA